MNKEQIIKVNMELNTTDLYDLEVLNGLIDLHHINGKALNSQSEEVKTIILNLIWTELNTQYPKFKDLCTGKTGYLNKIEERNNNTNLIFIGSPYMQLIKESNNNNWIWGSIEFKQLYNIKEKDYFKKIFEKVLIESVKNGYKVSRFKDIIQLFNIDYNMLKRYENVRC